MVGLKSTASSIVSTINDRYGYRSRKLTETNAGYVKVLFLFAILQSIAIIFFTRGFLLSRNVLPDLSTCSEQWHSIGMESEGTCFHPSPFKKSIILVIDALRFDFVMPIPEEDSPNLYYHNNFKILYKTFQNNPENSLLLKFIADPPTTTLQRLKGLTTGSLPTFIDAGSNFDGDTVFEDNFLSQLYHNNKSIAFTGDDTWIAMFSPFLNKSLTYPYDSLNVWDLHTVDNGVIEHLFPLMKNSNDWDVLIGHFLGVDHCGHRYGPDHYAMKDKLLQMNEIITSVIDQIDDETLLVVLGDHGMDSTGNHGGESDDEVEATLFMYSKSPHFKRYSADHYDVSNFGKNYRQVNQIDLTPTLSMLLGIPIPFNNLGSPIDEAFMKDPAIHSIASILTSSQINNYRLKSNELRDDTDINELYDMIFREWLTKPEEADFITSNNRYHAQSLHKCKERWANFDDLNIGIGIFLIFISLIVLIIYSKLVPAVVVSQLNYQCFLASFILVLVYCALCSSFSIVFKPESLPINWALLLGVALGIANGILAPIMDRYSVFWLMLQIKENLIQNGWTYCGTLIILMHSIIYASNSFIIWEDKIVSFWLISFGFLALFKSFQISSNTKKYLGAYHSFVFMILVRINSMITTCREEQGDKCYNNFKITVMVELLRLTN